MNIHSSRGQYEVAMVSDLGNILCPADGVAVVVDENVKRLHSPLGFDGAYELPAGEPSKSTNEFSAVSSWLAREGANRSTCLVAVGGGVTGDLVGFVAACFMRGIKWIMVPTTLLAMVDSSIGGKVAIDIAEGKNLVGAFWPPCRVAIDLRFLLTLSERDMLCGAAEVWKYGFIQDTSLLESLENRPLPRKFVETDFDYTKATVEKCLAIKAKIVEDDEDETSGLRAVLNFGHTVGHAIEAALGYGKWTHGEAISVGMVVEAKVGEMLGVSRPSVAQRVKEGLMMQGLPFKVPSSLEPRTLIDYMSRDKKSSGQGLVMSLLTDIGQCKLHYGIDESVVIEALTAK